MLGWVAMPLVYMAIQSYVCRASYSPGIGVMVKMQHAKVQKLQHYLVLLTLFFAIANIPFWFGLPSLADQQDLSSFGFDRPVFLGFFQNMHNAAGMMSLVAVALIFLAKNENRPKQKVILLVCAGIAVLALLQTYVRTGLLMFVIGLVLISLEELKRNKIGALALIFALFLILIFGVLNDEVFVARLLDQRTVGRIGDYRDLGSGRLFIWETTISNWYNNGLLSVVIGLGYGLSKTLMDNTIGVALVSHSGIVDALVQNGVIGLLLFLAYLISMYNYINRYRSSHYYPLAKAAFYMYLVYQFVQGGNQFFFIILFGILLAFLKYDINQKASPSVIAVPNKAILSM